MHILKAAWTADNDDDAQDAYHYVTDLKSRLADTCKIAQVDIGRGCSPEDSVQENIRS